MVAEVGEALERIERKLEALEKTVERNALPPQAFKIREAARLLSLSAKTVGLMVRKKKIRTVDYDGAVKNALIPMSEIVRLTSMTSEPARPPTPRTQADRPNGRNEAASLREKLRKRLR